MVPRMRNLRFLVLLAPALLAPALLTPVACGSSGEAAPLDAGPDTTAAATDSAPVPEDATADTYVAPKGVTVTVLTGTAPQVGVRVIFHDAAGLVTGESLTDATGKVALATAPSMVTVLTVDGTNLAPVTFQAVTDGDNLVVASPADLSAAAGSFQVSFTSDAVPTANSFSVHAGSVLGACDLGGNSPIALPLTADCVAAKNAVLLTASNGGDVLGFAFAKDVLAPVGSATVAVGPLAVALSGTTTVTATNAPAPATAGLYAIANGQTAPMDVVLPATGAIDTGSVPFHTPTTYADAYQTVISSGAGAGTSTALVRREATSAPPTATLASLDFATALPIIVLPTLVRTTPERPEITFVSPGALATADAAVVKVTYPTAANTTGRWTFVVPANTATFKVPALPSDSAAAKFLPTDAAVFINEVTFFEASQLPDYKAAKTVPIVPNLGVGLADTARPLPAAGTLRVSRLIRG
jgi:hypothetical protein